MDTDLVMGVLNEALLKYGNSEIFNTTFSTAIPFNFQSVFFNNLILLSFSVIFIKIPCLLNFILL